MAKKTQALLVKEAAELMGISKTTVYRWLESGKLEGKKMGKEGSWLINPNSIPAYIRRKKKET